MKKYKAALVLMVLVLMAALGAKQYSTITMGDDEWIGLGANAGRIVFDNQVVDKVSVRDAKFGVGVSSPSYSLDVFGDNGILVHREDSGTNNVLPVAIFRRSSTGTVADGFGQEVRFNLEDDLGVDRQAASIYTGWSDVSADESYMVFRTRDAGMAEKMRLDHLGNLVVQGAVLANGRIQTGDAASDIDARADMPVAVAIDNQGGYFLYNANVTADTDLTGLYSDEANVERQVRVEWLVYDVTAATKHSGEAVLEYTGGITSVVIADEGANDLLFRLARGADPNPVGYLCLDVVGNHSYEVVLTTMWH